MFVIYIFGGIVAIFILLQFSLRVAMKFKKGKPAPHLNGKAGSVIKSGKKALFYFYSPQCGACRAMTPVVKTMAGRNKNIFPINIAEDMETARKFGVMGTPSTVLVESGKIRDFIMGPKSETEIAALMG